jgi:hypothetical protein
MCSFLPLVEHTGEHGSKSKCNIKVLGVIRVGSRRGGKRSDHRPQARRDLGLGRDGVAAITSRPAPDTAPAA